MDFALSEEQAELASVVSAVLAKQADPAAVRAATATPLGYDETLWSTLCEQVGVAALAIPEEDDGAGATFFETAVVLEELGRSLAPSPLLATTVATAALLAGGADEARSRLLPRIAAGEIATVALDRGAPVLDADRAAIVLAVVGDDLVEVADPRATWAESVDQSLRLGRLASTDGDVVGDGAAARAAAELASTVGVAALAVGLCDRALRMTVDYSKERVQFGRPIGSFQALKHRMAEMLVRLELARSATWSAAYAVSRGTTDAPDLARAAASYALEAASDLAGECVQLHGGIAITWEHDAQLVFKRAHALAHMAGPPHALRTAVRL